VPDTVAVTGATGFIGSRLVARLLARGRPVRALARSAEAAKQLAAAGIEPVVGSLEDIDSLNRLTEGIEAVIHLAGLVKARNRAEFFRVNVEGTRRVAKAAKEAANRLGSPARFILVSSLAARSPTLSGYAASKRAGEEALEGIGLEWTVLRPPAVYGPGDREILPFFRAVARGIGPMTGARHARLSMIHADDLAAAIEAAFATRAICRVLEVHDGRAGGYSWAEMIDAAAAALGTRPVRVRVPAPVLRLIALAGAGKAALTGSPVMLTPDKLREVLHADWVVRDETLTEISGWRPAFSLAEGFRQTVAWYHRAGWL
jgi:2-alkyl-3-oxoalkanoate reductase